MLPIRKPYPSDVSDEELSLVAPFGDYDALGVTMKQAAAIAAAKDADAFALTRAVPMRDSPHRSPVFAR